MNVEKAKHLLSMLRNRTEQRGATPAEAAQAAVLAEKLIKRFGLDELSPEETEQTIELKHKIFPLWASTLAWAVRKRFKCETTFTRQVGARSTVTFRGAEHNVTVATWLFMAVGKDLHRSARVHAWKANLKGPAMVRFRNRFLNAASWEVFERLNPREVELAISEASEAVIEKPKRSCKPRKRKKPTKQELERQLLDSQAFMSGVVAGQQVQIGTDVLGGDSKPKLLEHQCRSTNV